MSLNPKSFHKAWLHTEHDPEGPSPDTGTRWRVFKLVILLAFLILTARLWQLQVLQANRFEQAATRNYTRQLPIEAQRGVFYDRSGIQLTTNVPLWDVSLTLAEMPEDEAEYQAALTRLEQRLQLGSVVAVDAADLSPQASEQLVQRVAATLQLRPEEVRAALAESQETEGPVVLAEDLTESEAVSARNALAQVQGAEVVLAVQWRVENSGGSRFRPALIAEDVTRETALAIEGDRLLIPGVSIEQVGARGYPYSTRLSAILGYVGKISAEQVDSLQELAASYRQRPYALDETVGKTGLEATLEPYLRGRPGMQEVEVTSTNRIVREGKLTTPLPGHNVTLTVDLRLQTRVESSLEKAMREAGATSGAAVVLDPRTGQILSLVTLPSYDNNAFIGGISKREYTALQQDPGNPLLNKAISGVYEPGVLLKPYVAAGGLAERIIDRNTKYPCAGRIEVPSPTGSLQRQIFQDSNPRPMGSQSVTEALANDCDTFFYILAGPAQRDETGRPLRYYEPGAPDATPFMGLGIDRMNRYLRNFGFGKPTGIELPGEAEGLVADEKWKLARFPGEPWTLTDTLRTAVGRGYTLVTPLQMATATATIANGGTVYKPQLVLSVTSPTGQEVHKPAPEQTGMAGMTPDHLQVVRDGMLQTTETGVGASLRKQGLLPKGVRVGASMDTPTPATADGLPPVAWFSAFAPYESPEMAVAVLIDAEAGSQHAARVGADVLKYMFETRKAAP